MLPCAACHIFYTYYYILLAEVEFEVARFGGIVRIMCRPPETAEETRRECLLTALVRRGSAAEKILAYDAKSLKIWDQKFS